MIYKHYELSQSLNGNNIIHIARNAAGMVVFRENSQKQLQTAIDNYFKNLDKEHQEKIKAAQAKAKPKTPEKPSTRLTKTSIGKFISKSSLDKAEPPKKKHFWG